MTKPGGARRPYALARGAALGALLAVLMAVFWFFIVFVSDSRHPYLMGGVGIAAGVGVHRGSRVEGWRPALVAVAVTVVVLVIGGYWVERRLLEQWFDEAGDRIDIPIVPYLDWLAELVRHTYTTSFLPAVFALLGVAFAAFFGYVGFEYDERRA